MQDYYCYYCYKHKLYCQYCQTSPMQLYYSLIYSSYYGQFYANYYAAAFSNLLTTKTRRASATSWTFPKPILP